MKSNDKKYDILIVLNRNLVLSADRVPYGALHANLAFAEYARSKGKHVALVVQAEQSLNAYRSIPVIGAYDNSDAGFLKALRSSGGSECLITNSNIELFRHFIARRQVVWMHNPHHPWGVEQYGRGLYCASSAVVCPSSYSAKRQREWGVPESLIRTIPNGIHTDRFNNNNSRRSRMNLVFLGACIYDKGIDIALQAFELLRKKYNNLELNVYGGCREWRASKTYFSDRGCLSNERPDLNKLSQYLPGLHYHGEVELDVLAKALRSASFLVLPSRKEETFGLVSLEAQACGCLPVLPDKGAFPETMHAGKTGFIYEDHTVEGLCAALESCFSMEESRIAAMRSLAAEQAGKRSWNYTAEEFLKTIGELPPLGRFASLKCALGIKLSRIFKSRSAAFG